MSGSPWRWALLPAWAIFRPIVAARNLAYDLGIAPSTALPVPVLSVGNLAVGGTGKTPLVDWMVRRLRGLGRRPAVLSRGYGGVAGVNEEAALVDAPVVCDPSRVRGGRRALAEGADCLVLDDGFQHRRLRRDCDIVLIDATRPWGSAGNLPAVIPLGLLREGRGSLRRADLLVVSRSDQVEPGILAALERDLARFGKPVVRLVHRPDTLTPLLGDIGEPPQVLAGQSVMLASGLGNPAGFERTARDLGWNVIGHHRFPDHHRYNAAEARALVSEARALHAVLVVTAKDAVKLREFAPTARVLSVRADFTGEGLAVVDALIQRALGGAAAADRPRR
ncbi:MAG: tetraacyldisaccharide 4'-kinase [Planctomycetes bacterium]|nr:tetraacyldisaccharide 4'-kinase [Planctomycetota bacterium]